MPVKIGDHTPATAEALNDASTGKTEKVTLDQLLTGDIQADAVQALTQLADDAEVEDGHDADAPQVSEDPKTGPVIDSEVDELAELLAWEAELKAQLTKTEKADRLKALKERFQTLGDLAAPDAEVVFHGASHMYQLGKKGTSRYIIEGGKAKIIEMLGAEQFLSLAEIKLGDLDKYLTQPQRETVLGVERTSRSGKMLDK